MRFRGLRMIVVGLLFLFIDINLSGFDIVPDPIGYALIVAGLVSLSGLHKAFAPAEGFAVIALIVSVFDAYLSVRAAGAVAPLPQTCDFCDPVQAADPGVSLSGWVASIAGGVSNVALVWLLGKGTSHLLAVRGLDREARATTACVIVNIIVLVLGTMPFPLVMSALPVLAFPVVVVALAAAIWLMVRLYRAYRALSDFDAASLEAMAFSPDEGA